MDITDNPWPNWGVNTDSPYWDEDGFIERLTQAELKKGIPAFENLSTYNGRAEQRRKSILWKLRKRVRK